MIFRQFDAFVRLYTLCTQPLGALCAVLGTVDFFVLTTAADFFDFDFFNIIFVVFYSFYKMIVSE